MTLVFAFTLIELTVAAIFLLIAIGVIVVFVLPHLGALFGSSGSAPRPLPKGISQTLKGDWVSAPSVIGSTTGDFVYKLTIGGMPADGANIRFDISDTGPVLVMSTLSDENENYPQKDGVLETDSSGEATLQLAASSAGSVTVSVKIELLGQTYDDPDSKTAEVDPNGTTQ